MKFTDQDIQKYIKPTKNLQECKKTIKLLLKEKDKDNEYRELARKFELYKNGVEEAKLADYYFYKYLESLEKKDQYTFIVENEKIEVKIDILNPYIEIKDDENNLIKVVHPQWHLMIAYYAYIDAMNNHNDNKFAKEIKHKLGYPRGNYFNIPCKSLNKWVEEAF